MSDTFTPDWIAEIEATESADSFRTTCAAQARAMALNRVNALAPAFFQDLLKHLQLNVDSLRRIGLRGSLCPVGAGPQLGARIEVGLNGLIAKTTWTTIFYTKGEGAIVAATLEGNIPPLPFVVTKDNEVCVLAGSSCDLLDSRATADLIVKRMALLVKN